jgi:hypothetical protein
LKPDVLLDWIVPALRSPLMQAAAHATLRAATNGGTP